MAALGREWRPHELDWVGSDNNPSSFPWTGTTVVRLDNSNAYLYRRRSSTSIGMDLFGDRFEEVRGAYDIWAHGGPSLAWFTWLREGEASTGTVVRV